MSLRGSNDGSPYSMEGLRSSSTGYNQSIGGNPLGGNPLGGNPLGGNPLGGNPLGGNPLGNSLGNPLGNSLGNPLGNSLGNPLGNSLGNPNPNSIGYGLHNDRGLSQYLDQSGRLDNGGGLGLGYHSSIPGGGQSHNSEFVLQKDDFPVLSSAHSQKGDDNNNLLMSGLSGKSMTGIGALNQDTFGQISLGQSLPGLGISQSVGGGLPGSLQARAGAPSLGLNEMTGGVSAVGSGEGRYGLAGLLDIIRMTDRDLSTLALGADLTSFGLNLNSSECLYTSFVSPFAELNAHNEPQFTTPPCYLMPPPNFKPEHLSKFQIETLFYMFYSMPRDILQAFSSQELYRRDWRYHAELRIWLKPRSPQEMMQGSPHVQFVYFDVNTWEARLFTTTFRGSITAGLLTEEQLTSG